MPINPSYYDHDTYSSLDRQTDGRTDGHTDRKLRVDISSFAAHASRYNQ